MNRSFSTRILFAWAVALTLGGLAHAWAADKPEAKPAAAKEKPKADERLQQLLKQFPKADADGDGVLTVEEARAYRAKIQGDRPARAPAREAIKPTMVDVKYGPYERNVLDFYKAESDQPTPLIIYIHGGGFVAGDKNSINQAILKAALDAKISCASLNYRFINGEDVLFTKPQRDSARAVQFLRSKAQEWNLDGKRIACYGGSAGAGTSMWIGFHDDLADPQASDPVLRESTRITAVGTFGGQGTYSPIGIKELIGGRAWEHPSIFKAYGLKTPDEALHPTPEQQKLYDEASAVTHLTKDDPPLYMVYNEADGPLPADARPGQGIHHPNFGRQLKKKMDELGIENVFVYVPEAKGRDTSREMFEFFKKHFEAVK